MINVFTGSMYSGKTNGIVNQYEKIWNKKIIKCFKPKTDTRELGFIQARYSNDIIDTILIEDVGEILNYINKNTKIIFIDEFQFLKGDIKIIQDLSMINDIDFYIAGLNMTSELQPFGIMPQLMAIANEITIYNANCYYCNKLAYYTLYIGEFKKTSDIVIGSDNYLPVCEKCFIKLNEKNKESLK